MSTYDMSASPDGRLGQGRCLRRVGLPALRPGAGLRRPGLLALDPGAPGSPAGGPPVTHQRQSDRADLVQVVRPVGRSTWTRSARPDRGKPAPPGSPPHEADHSTGLGASLEQILKRVPLWTAPG